MKHLHKEGEMKLEEGKGRERREIEEGRRRGMRKREYREEERQNSKSSIAYCTSVSSLSIFIKVPIAPG